MMFPKRFGMFLVPSVASAKLTGLADEALLAALQSSASDARHPESISLGVEWSELKDRIGTLSSKPWERLTPNERHRAARRLVAETLPSRRGGLLSELADLLAAASDESAGLWIVAEPPIPEPEGEVSPEESGRLLDEYSKEMTERRLALGPQAGTEILLRLLEVSTAAVTRARNALTKPGGVSAAEAVLADYAAAEQQSQVEGEQETVKRLLGLVSARVRERHDIYTPAGASELLAAIEQLEAKHGGEAKLAAAIDQAMENMWLFAADLPKLVSLQPLKWFKAALRRAVAHKNGFAIVFSTTLL